MTEVREPIPTRDHTERILRAAGVPVDRGRGRVAVSPVQELHLGDVDVPGDFSSAAPFIVAATALAGSNLTLRDVGVNPTRTGLLTVMERMGARVGVFRRRLASGEPVADIEVRPAELVAADVEPELVPLLVDELPLVALLACFAHGVTTIRGAGELRFKESDRIAATAAALNAVGGHVEPLDDGFRIRGVPTRLRGGERGRGRRPPGRDARSGGRRVLAGGRRGARRRRPRRELPRLRGPPRGGQRLTPWW